MAARRVQGREFNGEILSEILPTGGRHKRIGKGRWCGTAVGGSVRSVRGKDADGERFDGCVIQAKPCAHAGLSGTASNFSKQGAWRDLGRVSEADSRRKFIAGRGKRAGNAWIRGIQNYRGRTGKNHRLLVRFRGRNLIIFFVPGFNSVPAKAIIQSQVRAQMPVILREQTSVFVASIKRIELALVVLAGNPE